MCQHGLAAARRAHHQQVMPPRRGYLQRPPGLRLPIDVRKVGERRRCGFRGQRVRGGQRLPTAQMAGDLEQVFHRVQRQVGNQRGLLQVQS